VLPTENVAEFEFTALDADYRPVDAMERMYFELIVSAKWRLRRLQKFEAALYASYVEHLKKFGPDFVYVKEDSRLFVTRMVKRNCKDFLQLRAQTRRDLARQSQGQ